MKTLHLTQAAAAGAALLSLAVFGYEPISLAISGVAVLLASFEALAKRSLI